MIFLECPIFKSEVRNPENIPDNQIYLATGKIDYLFEVIRFIDDSENLQLAEQAEEAIKQGDLL